MNRSHASNIVGPWANQKLDALENYLAAYHKVMKNQQFKLIYIDAFAGAGWSKIRTTEQDERPFDLFADPEQQSAQDEFINGSPSRALGTGPGFDQYYFIEADERRASLLNELKNTYPNKEVHISVEDANVGVQRLARRFRGSFARGVVFLDPYGPHLHWKTVATLAETRKVDVIINFPVHMAINRLITKDPDVPKNWVKLLDEFFGTHDWYDLVYEEEPTLFGKDQIRKTHGTSEKLLNFYHRRLNEAFGHTVHPSLVKNTKGAPLYYLMWASSNSKGASIARHIMQLGDRIKRPS